MRSPARRGLMRQQRGEADNHGETDGFAWSALMWYFVAMHGEAEVLRKARLSAGLSPPEMAELVGLDEARAVALEMGESAASTELLDRYARVFGLSLRRFLAGEAESAPATMLFRSLHAERPSFEDLLETGATSVLGEFLRCVADVAELEESLGCREDRIAGELGALSAEPAQGAPRLYRQAERLAQDARTRLGLGLEPVPSMIELVQGRLGVTLFWIGPDELDRDIDGACARAPGAAILVNLVGGAECWWRTRMTLAHELCHLLFDTTLTAPSSRRAFLFSPHRGELPDRGRRPRLRLPADMELIEQRANAFAAHFLAPSQGVRDALGALPPTSSEAIDTVCERFQIGRVTAVNQITNTYRCSREERLAMIARSARGPSDLLPKQHPDAVVRTGLRAGRLRDLVARALAEGRIGKARARQVLALRLSEPLPQVEPLAEEQRTPVLSPEQVARLAAQRYLSERGELAGCYPARVTREGDRLRVEVEQTDEMSWGAPRARGYLILSAAFKVLEDESHIEPNTVTLRVVG
ncbi:XRE family transcriptional regulator [Sorangium sp. So ce119]|uniref:helix-turn-helix domain-containing protein n=1 Tax=Sorangium sp. So ce119 TaxID=3133279 RepID=UPI003F5F0596